MREEILRSIDSFLDTSKSTIVPGLDYIPTSGKVIDGQDLKFLVDSVLDASFTAGRYANKFEN